MHLTAPSHWSLSIVTGGRDASERVVTIVVARTHQREFRRKWLDINDFQTRVFKIGFTSRRQCTVVLLGLFYL